MGSKVRQGRALYVSKEVRPNYDFNLQNSCSFTVIQQVF